ncbi:E3 ubiquitin-protein ligase WAVH1-like [Rutidosis leptorrhynchoides]|uniref:E3 ubiquitin-protein ligase WAVH1-like n=1 Tax=Rutidosis leptorrhynchoides TaxID=125765 RepID=UPI003A99DA4B
MVLGWRRAFCTSVPGERDLTDSEEHQYDQNNNNNSNIHSCNSTPKFSSMFNFFSSSSSNPSTPSLRSNSISSTSNLRCRTTPTEPIQSASTNPVTPKKLECQPKNSPTCFLRISSSNPSSPRSPSPFSFIKSSLRLNTRRCGLCLQSVKKGQGIASFTAECSHTFHFPCISDHTNKQRSLSCPVCSCLWKDMPLLSLVDNKQNIIQKKDQLVDEYEVEEITTRQKLAAVVTKRHDLKVYNDDEPLASLTPKARFNPIPESDENCDEDSIEEFQGFHANCNNNSNATVTDYAPDVEVQLLPETALIASSRKYETYAVVLKVKAPSAPEKLQRRAPIDLVTVIDVSGKMSSEKLQIIKNAMRLIIASLSSSDRLSIVAFSSYSKRLLPLRRMTTSGRRAARRIVDAMAVLEGSSNSKDAVKKAVKVVEDRKEKNPVARIILLSEVVLDHSESVSVSTTRYGSIAVHSLKLVLIEDLMLKYIASLICVTVQDLQIDLGFVSGSVQAVYSRTPQPILLGSSTVQIGELSADEEKELFVELKVPSSALRSHQVLTVRCCYRELSSQQMINGTQQTLIVQRPTTARSSSVLIQRLRNVFISTRALAESRRLAERNDLNGAYHMLVSARALLLQLSLDMDNELVVSLDDELSEVQRQRKVLAQVERKKPAFYTDEKGEPLTPTSAWKVADKLAKVAIMRKSVKRVSDLHGFEDARF